MGAEPSQPTIPPSNSSKPRFCPYCGIQVSEGASFCDECGHQLPSKKTAVGPAPQTFQPSNPVNVGNLPPTQPEKTLREVAITISQKKAIQNVYSAPAGITRIFGAMLGVAAILVGVFDAQGTSLDPTTFAIFVLGISIFAIALSGASRSLRKATSRVISRGKVMELTGVPRMNSSPSNEVAKIKPWRTNVIDIGGTQFMMPSQCSNLIRYDSANRIVYATGDFYPNGNLQAVLFLGINETNFGKAIHGSMAVSGYRGYGGNNSWSVAKKRRM